MKFAVERWKGSAKDGSRNKHSASLHGEVFRCVPSLLLGCNNIRHFVGLAVPLFQIFYLCYFHITKMPHYEAMELEVAPSTRGKGHTPFAPPPGLFHAQKNCPKSSLTRSSLSSAKNELQFNDVLGLRTAVALNYVEFNALAFVQRLVAIAYDCAEVNEYIVAAFNFDKTETFFRVEPFHRTCLHVPDYLQKLVYLSFIPTKEIKNSPAAEGHFRYKNDSLYNKRVKVSYLTIPI